MKKYPLLYHEHSARQQIIFNSRKFKQNEKNTIKSEIYCQFLIIVADKNGYRSLHSNLIQLK